MGIYTYGVDTCPRRAEIALLFTVAVDTHAAQSIFRKHVHERPDYRPLMGILSERVIRPLPAPNRFDEFEVRKYSKMFLAFQFEFVDPRPGETTLAPVDRVSELLKWVS